MTLAEQIGVYVLVIGIAFMASFLGLAVGMTPAIRVLNDRRDDLDPRPSDERAWLIGSMIAFLGPPLVLIIGIPIAQGVTGSSNWRSLLWLVIGIIGWLWLVRSLSGVRKR